MLRRAEVSDVERLHAIRAAAITALARTHYEPDQLAQWISSRTPESYVDPIRQHIILVVQPVGHQVAGFGHLDPSRKSVEAICVHLYHAHRGIGTRLLRALESEAVAFGMAFLSLEASFNAEAFYRKAGYLAIDECDLPNRASTRPLCVAMGKRLGST